MHTRQVFGLKLDSSGIPNSGTGLFSMKRFRRGAQIAKYTGVEMTQEEYDAIDSGYGIADQFGTVIDSASTQSTIARYANDCRPENKAQNDCPGNNAEFVDFENYDSPDVEEEDKIDGVWLCASKTIRAGDEIFVDYGGNYN